MILPGSEILGKVLHLISQSLLLPVIAGLLILIARALIELGSLASEYAQRKELESGEIGKLVENLRTKGEIALDESFLYESQKKVLKEIFSKSHLSPESLRALTTKLVEEEELRAVKVIEKTDIITRLGPALGLMGTLIPLGPGLAALGRGDVSSLAQAMIIAFDTTVVGLAAGSIAYAISKIRRRWYETNLGTLETLVSVALEFLGEKRMLTGFSEISPSVPLLEVGRDVQETPYVE